MKPRHRRTRRSLLVAIAGLGVLAVAAAISLGAAGSDTDDHSASVLFTQSATSGSLTSAAGNRMTLTLRGVAPQVIWFQDRPERHAGHISATAFVSHWRSFGFQSDAPNAALTLLNAPDNADTVVVELLRPPRYNSAQGTLTYEVRLLSQTPDRLDDFGADVDAAVPSRFGVASLFIDDAQAPIAGVGRRDPFLAAADGGAVEMQHSREERPRLPPR
jgi:hypothetical protein